MFGTSGSFWAISSIVLLNTQPIVAPGCPSTQTSSWRPVAPGGSSAFFIKPVTKTMREVLALALALPEASKVPGKEF